MVVVLFSLGCVIAKPLKECEYYKKYLYFKITLNMIQIKGIFLTRIKKNGFEKSVQLFVIKYRMFSW